MHLKNYILLKIKTEYAYKKNYASIKYCTEYLF